MPADRPHSPHRERLDRRTERPVDPRVRLIKLQSKALGVPKRFYIALPPGYKRPANMGIRYPVLYLFRGHEREWVHRWQDKSRRGRTVIDIYRDLLAQGKVGPMILVFPGISSSDNRLPGLLVNFLAPELARKAPGVGTGRFEDYFLQELVPYVDANFRTIAERGGRAVDGFSLGGFQSIKIAAQHPELFCSAGAFDGTFLYATYKGKALRATDRVLRNPMLGPAFGVPRDIEYVAANSPANLLWRAERDTLAGVQWMVRSGPKEAEPWQSNYYRAQHVIGILETRHLENGVAGVMPEATHSWHWADKHMEGTLPLHWQALQPATFRNNAQRTPAGSA
ncbi:MAG TPA: alpha/beta hydrolase-fold protein [Chloroflexia bacterium]|nr:alpha/beta hydrolase-fold protein [Chloroflexia bacterium]